MYSQCPDCRTRFRVTAAHLRAAGGTVRCGRCGAAFDALATLTDTLQAPEVATLALAAGAVSLSPKTRPPPARITSRPMTSSAFSSTHATGIASSASPRPSPNRTRWLRPHA